MRNLRFRKRTLKFIAIIFVFIVTIAIPLLSAKEDHKKIFAQSLMRVVGLARTFYYDLKLLSLDTNTNSVTGTLSIRTGIPEWTTPPPI